MPQFAVTAVDARGTRVQRAVEASDREAAMAQVKDQGLYPTRVVASAPPVAEAPRGRRRRARVFGGVSLGQLAQLTQQLATLMDAGLPIVRSLRLLRNQQRPGVLRDTLEEVAEEVESGATLSEALGRHPRVFDRLFVGMVRAGEAGGVLDVILERLAEFLEKSLRLRRKVVGALTYPLVVTIVAVSILGGIMTFVIPAFQKMFEETGVALPTATRVLIEASSFVASYWFLLPGIPLALVLALRALRAHPEGRYQLDRLTLHLPLFAPILRKSTIARFCRTLGTLVRSGVPILEALSITREATTNLVIARAIDDVHAAIREGEGIARPLEASGAFDELTVNMIDVGEETGEVDAMLTKIAENYEGDVDVAVESLSSVIEPLLIVGMGGAVGFIVIALFLPLITLTEKLG